MSFAAADVRSSAAFRASAQAGGIVSVLEEVQSSSQAKCGTQAALPTVLEQSPIALDFVGEMRHSNAAIALALRFWLHNGSCRPRL